MAVTLGSMDWRLGVDNAGFQSGLANAEKQAKGFGSNITKALATGAKVAFGAAVVGVGALGVVLGQSMKEAMAAEEVTAQLNAAIKSTGGVAGVSAKQIQDHALALSQVTRFEDDAIVSADALLLTFTNIGKDVFPQATKATLNMATTFKMDLASSAKMVGKALNDPVKGLTALSKAGVQFSDDQKAVIKAMVETGNIAGAQTLILRELEVQTGGSAEAAGKTAAGQMDIFRNALGNVKEEIGGALIPVLKDLLEWAGPKLISGLQKFSDWFRTSLADVEQFAGKLGKAKDMIGGMIADVQAGKKIEWQDLMNLAGLFTNQEDIKLKFGHIVTDIQTAIGNVKAAFDEGGLAGVFALVWKSIGDWWTSDAIPFATELGATISAWWSGTFLPALAAIDWASIGASMQNAWNTLRDWWLTEAVPFATEVATSISTWFVTQVIPALQTHAPEWGAAFGVMLKSMITINGQMLGSDANLAYTLGAGFVKLLISSLKALSVGPQLVLAALRSAFEGGLGKDADWSKIFGDIFGPIKDFLLGALDALLLSMLGDATAKIGAWWAKVWASITGKLNGIGGGGGNSGAGGGGAGGANSSIRGMQGDYGGAPVVVPANTNNRAMAGNGGANNFYFDFRGSSGNQDTIRKAASQGVNEALRARGYR